MSQMCVLGDVADVVAGVGFPKDMQGGQDGEIPVFKVGDISAAWLQGKSLLNDSRNYLSRDDAVSLGKCVPAGATVFAKIGEALRLNRRVMLGRDALVDNNVMGLVPKREKVAPKYLYYFMQTVDLGELSRSTTVPSIRKSDVVEIGISIPELAAQNEIVAEIDKQFSRLDEAVANLQRVKANLKRYKAAVLKAAVEGRLVETEAELARREGRSYETGEQLLQRILEARHGQWTGRGKYKDPVPPDVAEGGALPSGWVLASSEQVCASVRDGTHDTPNYVSAGVPLITSKNLGEHGIDFDNVKFISENDHEKISKRSGVAQGDILFAMIGTVGNPCEIKTANRFSIKNVGLFKSNSDFLYPTYFCYWLQSNPLNKWLEPRLKGTTQKFAPLGLLRELPVFLPPLAEQRRIVAEVDRRLSIVHEVETEVDANLKRAQALRQAVLSRCFQITSDQR